MRKVLLVAMGIMLWLSGSLVTGCTSDDEDTVSETIKIVDSVGRVVEVPQPLERIVVLDHYGGEVVRAIGAKDKIVGINDYMAERADYWPVLKDVPSAGSFSEPNYEKIAELNPQVVVTCDLGVAETEEKLEPLGITVVRLDFYKPNTFVSDISTLGLMMGHEEEAQGLIDFFQQHLDTVQEQVGNLTAEEKVSIYYEGNDYTSVAGNSGWHEVILLAGGVNIFSGETTGSWGTCQVSPEAILAKNPSAVWKYYSGGYIPAEKSEMLATYNSLVNRAGWADIDAVKNDNVIVMNYWMAKGCGKLVTICYMAKLLYPEKFQDMNPEEVSKQWIEKFQGVEYKGGYAYPNEADIWS